MSGWLRSVLTTAQHLYRFSARVMRSFVHNKGLLVAGALGYNSLLSFIPLTALVTVVLSLFVDQDTLVDSLALQISVVFPNGVETLRGPLTDFFDQRDLWGVVGLAIMLLFSTIGFRMLEDAMKTVFGRTQRPKPRSWVLSWLLSVGYVGIVTVAIVALTLTMVAIDTVQSLQLSSAAAAGFTKFAAFVLLVAMLGSFYWLLPQTSVRPRRALIGGLVAGTLWELVRSTLVWYFANVSFVNAIYGSFATVIVVLLSLEIAAVIVLLGAEVIAAIERSLEHDVPWWQEPKACLEASSTGQWARPPDRTAEPVG